MKNRSCKNYVYIVWKFQTCQHATYWRMTNMSNIVDMCQLRPIYCVAFNKGEVDEYLKDNDYYYYIVKKYYGELGKLKKW